MANGLANLGRWASDTWNNVTGAIGGAASTAVNWGANTLSSAWNITSSAFGSAVHAVASPLLNFGASFAGELNRAWTYASTELGNFATAATAAARDVSASIGVTANSLSAAGGGLTLDGLVSIGLAMVSDPHSLFAMASLVPGLGEVAAMMDMALYLAEGDFASAATAGLQFLPGGALLVLGAGAVGARHLVTLARAAHGAEGGIKAALEGTRVVQKLEKAGGAVKSAVAAAGSRIKRWIRGGEKAAGETRVLEPGAYGGIGSIGGKRSYFDIGVVGESPSSRNLGRNLVRDGEVRPAESAGHHLLPANEPGAAAARTHLEQDLRIGINSGQNGSFLPRFYASANPLGRVVHPLTMTDSYIARANELILGARTQAEGLDTLAYIKDALEHGRLP